MKRYLSVFLKGLWIGGTLTVPGVSGGSMAMILGIYEQLVRSVNNLIGRGREKWESFRFLLFFCAGGLTGVLALSWVVVWLMKMYPVLVVFFFAGAVAGGIPVIFHEVKDTAFKWYYVPFLLGGIILVLLLQMIPPGLFEISQTRDLRGIFLQMIGGIIAAAALVLPGISVSHMLYVLGIYKGLMISLSTFDFLALIPFAIGVIIGVLLTARAVDYLFSRHKTPAYLIILGFVLGSVGELLAGVQLSDLSWGCLPLFAAGFFCIYLMFKKSKAGA